MEQITKNCKLVQRNLKLENEVNFTKEQYKVLNEKHKKDEMDKNDQVRVIVKKQQQKIDKRMKELNLLYEQQKPFISNTTHQLQIADVEYVEVHDK